MAVAMAAATLVPAGPASAASEAASGDVFTFVGGGFGHSVGLSQFGAYGMALEGYEYDAILRHYYTGTTIEPAADEILDEPVWVNLSLERSSMTWTVVQAGSAPASGASLTLGGATLDFSAGDSFTITAIGSNSCRITSGVGTAAGPCNFDIAWDGWAASPTTALEQADCTQPDWNSTSGTTWRPCRYARGTMHIRPDNDSATFAASVSMDIEHYMLGISESPYWWGDTGGQEALMAQAVAARSYALNRVVRRGDSADRPWCWCHLYDTTVDQHYVGWGHGREPWIDAVSDTAGEIVTHPTATMNGELIPVEAFYSSSTFGRTEASEDGFGAYIPYLRSVDDHWSQMEAVGNHSARWTRQFTGDQLATKLPGVSTVSSVEITRCSDTGAALEITFSGGGDRRAFKTRDLRGLLGIKSMQVFNAGSPLPTTPPCDDPAGVPPSANAGPVSLVSLTIDDDDVMDSRGNGNGIAQCGETIEVGTTITNEGTAGLVGLNAILTTTDEHSTVVWNGSSTFQDLTAGASRANTDDWDIGLSADTPDGHVATFSVAVSAANAGPWTLEFAIPVTCDMSTDQPTAMTVIGDLDHDGADATTAAIAVAIEQHGTRPRLLIKDGATGEQISIATLASEGFTVIDLETIHVDTRPSVAVVLLDETSGRARLVVVDAATGEKHVTAGLSRRYHPVDLEPAGFVGGGPATDVAILSVREDGRVRVFVRDGGDGSRVSTIGAGKAVEAFDLEIVPQLRGRRRIRVGGPAAPTEREGGGRRPRRRQPRSVGQDLLPGRIRRDGPRGGARHRRHPSSRVGCGRSPAECLASDRARRELGRSHQQRSPKRYRPGRYRPHP